MQSIQLSNQTLGILIKRLALRSAFLSILTLCTSLGYSQLPDIYIFEVPPPFSVTDSIIENATTIKDIHKYYKPSWVASFQNVVINGKIDGQDQSATSKNDTLTHEQKQLLLNVDHDSDIAVLMQYYPDNSLKNNGLKSYDFKFKINPQFSAYPINGQDQVIQSIQDAINPLIGDEDYTDLELSGVTFSVDSQGAIQDAQLTLNSENSVIDQVILETICNMPHWNPAKFSNGKATSQNFAITIGNIRSCTFNFLNIDRDYIEDFILRLLPN